MQRIPLLWWAKQHGGNGLLVGADLSRLGLSGLLALLLFGTDPPLLQRASRHADCPVSTVPPSRQESAQVCATLSPRFGRSSGSGAWSLWPRR